MNKIRRIVLSLLAAIILSLGAIVATSAPASAAPQPWHIKNSINSRHDAFIYKSTTCSSSADIHVLNINETAQSTLWTGMRVWAYDFNVAVYNGDTGNYITDREYDAGDCVRAYTTNDYLITVYNF